MILCQDGDYWFTSTGVSRERGVCAVRCGPGMLQPSGMTPLPPVGAVVYGLRPLTGIRFFPALRYNGFQVWPFAWHPTEVEPILLIEMDPSAKEVFERYGLRWGKDAEALRNALRHDGWDIVDPRECARTYVHVDDLEKIEGPPPEGAF